MEWSDNDGTITGKSAPFTPSSILFRPRRTPFSPGLGGAAGYCPRVRKAYYDGHLSPYPACAGTIHIGANGSQKKTSQEPPYDRQNNAAVTLFYGDRAINRLGESSVT